jgi:hypothetical protein
MPTNTKPSAAMTYHREMAGERQRVRARCERSCDRSLRPGGNARGAGLSGEAGRGVGGGGLLAER